MGKNKTILLVIFLIFLSAQFFSQTANSKMSDQEELEVILKKCAEYCERLENSSLYFVCEEAITEEIFPIDLSFPNPEINRYIYEYQLVRHGAPKFPDEFNAIYGKIWIRKKNFNILKIEWEQESMENFEAIEKIADRLEAKPKITFVSEYAFEKNKIRFPSMYSVDENFILAEGIEYNRSRITVIYDSYKFFTVDTKVKY